MKSIYALVSGLILALSVQASYARVYTLGVEDIDYYPIYKTKNGEYSGFVRDLFDQFGKDKGYEFRYESLPVVRLTNYFLEGQVDFKFPDNSAWAQDAKAKFAVIYSEPVIKYTDGVMVLPTRPQKGLEGFKNLGTVRGFSPWDFMDLAKEGKVVLKEASNLESLANQALNARIDGAYFNVDVARYFLKNTIKQPEGLVFDESLPHTTSTYHLSTISHPDVMKDFNAFLVEKRAWVEALKIRYELDKH